MNTQIDSDRFTRQRDLVPADKVATIQASVIGVGAIGRNVALQLAAIGTTRLQLFDYDHVDQTNVTTQGYCAADIGEAKVEATERAIYRIDPVVSVQAVKDRFRSKHAIGQAVFCCVDSISARAAIWRSVKSRCQFWVDGRMQGEVIRVICATNHADCQRYESTLFPQSQAQIGSCTSRSTIYSAKIAAGLMIHQFTRWLRHLTTDFNTSLNLLASEMAIT